MHVARLAQRLAACGIEVRVLDHFPNPPAGPVVGSLRRNSIRYWRELRRREATVVHLHYSGRPTLLIAAAAARRRGHGRWVLTVHSHALDRVPSTLNGIIRWALRRMDHAIAVSPPVAARLRLLCPELEVCVLPAYLAAGGEETQDPVSWPPAEFVLSPGRCLLISAYRVRPLGEHSDLYGLHLAIDVLADLADSHPDLRLAIFIATKPKRGSERRYLHRQLTRAEGLGLAGRVACFYGMALQPAFHHSQCVYLRPTRSDGDAVSVREALAAGIPVIASDAAARPSGVEMVALTDRSAWTSAVTSQLAAAQAERGPRSDDGGSLYRYLHIYGFEEAPVHGLSPG